MNIQELKPIGSKGSRAARIVIVGEAPGADEVREGFPFVGASGHELDKMLKDAGILTYKAHPSIPDHHIPDYEGSGVYFTNVTLIRPPDNDIEHWVRKSKRPQTKGKKITPTHWVPYRGWMVEPHVAVDAASLVEDIKSIKPNVVIALGHTAFWALCKEGAEGKTGTWRGSTLESDVIPGLKVIPAYHPAFILRQWQHRRITVQDFRRALWASSSPALPDPMWEFTIAPTYEQVTAFLTGLWYRAEAGETVDITNDIEGTQMKCICLALGISDKQAICIPFLYRNRFYWSPEKHTIIVMMLQRLHRHKNVRVCNQNIGFDLQFWVNDFLMYPLNITHDTMIAQNVLFPGTPMNLAYQASMYCNYYRYWKDDSDEFWKKKRIDNWENIWFYNCEDSVRTWEIWHRHEKALPMRNLQAQFDFLQKRVFRLLRKAMFRGVRVNTALKDAMLVELIHVMRVAQDRVNMLATRQLDCASPAQLADFFYKEMKLDPIFNDEGTPTCDADALVELGIREPLVREVCKWINLVRSYITGAAVCRAQVEEDGRWLSSYSLGIVETYRLSSKKNVYGRGLNLTNVTGGKAVKGSEEED